MRVVWFNYSINRSSNFANREDFLMQLDKRSLWVNRLSRWFVIYLFVNPLLDIINGMYMIFIRDMSRYMPSALTPLTPTLVIRMLVLVVMALFLLLKRDWKSVKLLIPIAVAGVMSMVVEFFFMDTHGFFADIQYLGRFTYNVAALFVFTHVLRADRSREDAMALMRRALTFSAVVVSASILVCFCFNIGFHSYADRFGLRGTSGFYYAANEATAILMLLLPLSISDFLRVENYKRSKNWAMLLAPALVANAIMLIGTKTAFIALIVSLALMGAHTIWLAVKQKGAQKILRFGLMVASVAVVFLVLTLLSSSKVVSSIQASIGGMEDVITEDIDNTDLSKLPEDMQAVLRDTPPIIRLLLSGRQYYLFKAADAWSQGPALGWFFGIGRGSQSHVIEMDLFEIFFYYGIFGFAALCLPYIRRIFPLFKGFWRLRDSSLAFAIFVSLGLTFFYLCIAGHVLFSVTGGFYFALVVVYGGFVFERQGDGERLAAKKP